MASVRVVVDSRVRLLDALPADAAREVCSLFEHRNQKHYALRAMGYAAAGEPPVIETWRESGGLLDFPRGGFSRVRYALGKLGHEVRVSDRRCRGDAAAGALIPAHRIPVAPGRLWPHQERIVEAILREENCLVICGTGGGKTSAALAAASGIRVPTLVIVWSAALREQWVKRIVAELRIPPDEVGQIGAGKVRLRPVTVGMQQTIAARGVRPEWDRYFGCVFLDETQRAPAPSVFAAIDPWSARYRVGMSASHKRKDKKEFLTLDLFGRPACEVTRAELVRAGHIVDVEVRIVRTGWDAPWYRGAARAAGDFFLPVDGADGDRDFNRLLDEMRSDAERNRLVSSVATVAGSRVVVLTHRREHAAELALRLSSSGSRTGLLLGTDGDRAEFDRTVAGLSSGDVDVGVGTYQAFGVGIDVPAIDAVVCATPIAGNQQFFAQVVGRACRATPGKRAAVLYYLHDEALFPQHRRNLVAWNERVSEQVARRGPGESLWVRAKL